MNVSFIKNAAHGKSESAKKLMDGIINVSLNEFQKNSVDGLLDSGMPSHSSEPSGSKPNLKSSGKAPATKMRDGVMPYPGAKGYKGRK